MVLTIISFVFLAILSGCATTGGYERIGVYSERNDMIYEHRASFPGDGRISMAYSIAYWDVLQIEEKGDNIPEVYYIWLRNNSSVSLRIDPVYLSLVTENGETIPVSSLTDETPEPLKAQEADPYDTVAGYAVFDIKSTTIETDRPSRLIYDDKAGLRTIRYLQVEDMEKYEDLRLDMPVYYYAPVYPRRYWYPYYYPYNYYPYDSYFYYSYSYTPHRHYYYYSPAEPGKRRFNVPPSEPSRQPREKKKREF
ncbi:MAG: hypothetical protein IT392_02985 [Nitrospirae bacterium]|nr:hypothetical protein [Nitrospirota bacterium]